MKKHLLLNDCKVLGFANTDLVAGRRKKHAGADNTMTMMHLNDGLGGGAIGAVGTYIT